MFFLSDMLNKKVNLPSADEALPGRSDPIATADRHFVNDRPLHGTPPEGMKEIYFGMGCFWGVERLFWQAPGVFVTAAGYAGGHTPNPTYHETCTGMTGHAEVVKVVYDPGEISLAQLLKLFWEGHDPTQGMRQGNDVGSVYRSIILATDSEQFETARASRDAYQASLEAAGKSRITTEIVMATDFYYAEDYHQQYLAKNPDGYCGLQGTGVACAMPSPVPAT